MAELHMVITVQCAEGTGALSFTIESTVTTKPGTPRREVFLWAVAECRKQAGIPEHVSSTVLLFVLEPNAIEES